MRVVTLPMPCGSLAAHRPFASMILLLLVLLQPNH